jgi:acyl-CoA oxidase
LRFRSVRIPRDNLLNRFGDVSRDGKYTSSLPSINKRFAATLGELVGGRVGLAYSSVSVLKVAATIAIRYSLLRQQFGPPKQPEVSILDYQSQQHKLMPMLASTYAFHFATLHLVEKYSEMKKSHDEQLVGDVHALSAGLKAYVTSYTAKSLSTCRESCGGHGYAAVNRFGILRNDHDIFQTFEGDNTVLLQQVANNPILLNTLLKTVKHQLSQKLKLVVKVNLINLINILTLSLMRGFKLSLNSNV